MIDLPDAELVDENAAEQRKHHIWEGVNRVETRPLSITQAERFFLELVFQRSRVVIAEVATHKEEAAHGKHDPAPASLPDQQLLFTWVLGALSRV